MENTNLVLVTPPTDEALSLADCKIALGITGTDQDTMIQAAIDGVVSAIDAASGGYLGRALRPQTWELRQNGFWDFRENRHHLGPHYRHEIQLPFPPLISVVNVKYDDVSGSEQTLVADTDYRVFGVGTLGKGYIAPAYGKCWPDARCDEESVRIQFTAGYAVAKDPAPDAMPSAITSAIALAVRSIISNAAQNLYLSQDVIEGVGSQSYVVSSAANLVIQQTVDTLLSTYRMW
jgi:hypothetical protein